MQTALVTGATGFLGGALAQRLASEGIQVKALARRPNRDAHLKDIDNIEIVMGDITDAARMRDVMAGCDTVFHVAAALQGTMAVQRPVNVTGTRNVMQAAVENDVRRVVHVSSIATYGYNNHGRVHEDRPPMPGNVPYNITKAEAENVLWQFSDQIEVTALRPGLIYGPRSQFWTATLFQVAKRGIWFGDGSGNTHPIYVDDVVDLMLTQATHPNAIGEAFNCAADPAPTWREFLGAYAALANQQRWRGIPLVAGRFIAPIANAGLRLAGQPQALTDLIRYANSETAYAMDKARDLLDWSPQVSLEDGVQRCVPYLREKGLLT